MTRLGRAGRFSNRSRSGFGRLVLLGPAAIIATAFYALAINWMFLISMTNSDLAPVYEFVGLEQYARLFASERWWCTVRNLGLYTTLVLTGCIGLGYGLAIALNRGLFGKTVLQLILILPLAVSFVVTALVWQWLLSPDYGVQQAVRGLGASGFTFNWLARPDRVVAVLAMVSIWQQVGMCMMLFLIGLRRIDRSIWDALEIDGASGWRLYVEAIAPLMTPYFLTAVVFVSSATLRTYDLVTVLTGGGPGFASDLPAHFVIEQILERQGLGLGAAGACLMLVAMLVAATPYLIHQGFKGRGS